MIAALATLVLCGFCLFLGWTLRALMPSRCPYCEGEIER